jgi:hypothetical protein
MEIAPGRPTAPEHKLQGRVHLQPFDSRSTSGGLAFQTKGRLAADLKVVFPALLPRVEQRHSLASQGIRSVYSV